MKIYMEKNIFIIRKFIFFIGIFFVRLENSIIDKTPKVIKKYTKIKSKLKNKYNNKNNNIEVKILYLKFFEIIYFRNFF